MRSHFLIAIAVFLLPAAAFADSIQPPCSYVAHSANKQFAFVMLAPVSDTECAHLNAVQAAERKDLRKRFSASGVYENADPKKPKWQLKEPWFAYEVFVSDDGESVVRLGPWAQRIGDEAFSFFHEGKISREVLISELIDENAVQRTVSHFFWKNNAGITTDGKNFFVDTLEGHSFTFDLNSGVLISTTKASARSGSSSSRSCFGMFVGLMLMAGVFAFRRVSR